MDPEPITAKGSGPIVVIGTTRDPATPYEWAVSLAEQLDNLQERYSVSFVISAGNYQTLPLMDYPRSGAHLDSGRITSPADSILGITVGAVSHLGFRQNGPQQHQPTAYSRHGAGPNYVIKPDLVHYGGTCSTDGATVHGIRSERERLHRL